MGEIRSLGTSVLYRCRGCDCYFIVPRLRAARVSCPAIVADFGVWRQVATISITTYVDELGVGPLVSSGLSETYGRRAINAISFPVCLLFIMVPVVSLAFCGAGNSLVFDSAVLYLIDC